MNGDSLSWLLISSYFFLFYISESKHILSRTQIWNTHSLTGLISFASFSHFHFQLYLYLPFSLSRSLQNIFLCCSFSSKYQIKWSAFVFLRHFHISHTRTQNVKFLERTSVKLISGILPMFWKFLFQTISWALHFFAAWLLLLSEK